MSEFFVYVIRLLMKSCNDKMHKRVKLFRDFSLAGVL